MEVMNDTAEEVQADSVNQTADTPEWSSVFKTDFREKHKDTFGDATSVTEWGEKVLAKQDALKYPGPNASAEELSAYREAFGVPESSDGYQFDKSQEAWEGDIDRVKEVAAKYHFNQDQANAAMEILAASRDAFQGNVDAERNRLVKETQDTLTKEYGEKAEAKLNLARSVVRRFGGEDFLAFLDDSSLGNDIRLAKVLIGVGEAISEDTLDDGGGAKTPHKSDGLLSFPNTPGME